MKYCSKIINKKLQEQIEHLCKSETQVYIDKLMKKFGIFL